jgi:hypothetical protein
MGEVMPKRQSLAALIFACGIVLRTHRGWRERPLTEPRKPLLVNGEALKDRYLPWYIERLHHDCRRKSICSRGRHSMYLDGIGFFPRLGIKGIIDDDPQKKALNRLPIVSLAEALRRGAQLIIVSTDAYEPQVMERLRNGGIAENMINRFTDARQAAVLV